MVHVKGRPKWTSRLLRPSEMNLPWKTEEMSNAFQKKRKLWATYLPIVTLLSLPSCTGSDSRSLVGRWVTAGAQLEVKENGILMGNFYGNRWRGQYRMSNSSRSRAVAAIPIQLDRRNQSAIELTLLTGNTIRLTEVREDIQQSPTQTPRRLSPQIMIMSRAVE